MRFRWVVMGAACVAALAGCADSTQTSTPTTTVVTETVTASPSADPIVAVDPADYAVAGSPGYYRWTYTTTDNTSRECGMFPANAGFSAGVTCSAPFPDDAPTLSNDGFTGPPNSVRLTDNGTELRIGEGGPPGAQPLEPGRRITVGAYSCRTLPTEGIDCSGPDSGFRVSGGATTQRGTIIEPQEAGTESSAATGPSENYTEGTEPVAPGTMCGVATGHTPVQVVSGSISCADAIAVIDGYIAAPDDGSHGNAKIMEYQGWSCSAPTYGMSQDLGYSAKCTKDDVEVIRPTS